MRATHQIAASSETQAFNTTTSMGRLTLNVLLSFAQFEREVTGERIRDKIAQLKAKGMWMGGNVPLGYQVVDRQLVVVAPEAEQVNVLFERYLAPGAVDALVAEADRRGIRSKRRTGSDGSGSGGTKLGRGSLYRILANPLYAGEVGHKGQRHPGQHQRIGSAPLYDTVQALLESNRRKRRGTTTGAATPMLSGLVATAAGERLTATHTSKGQRRYRYYAGTTLRLPAEELETLVTDSLVEHLGAPAKLATLLPDLDRLTPPLLAKSAEIAASLGHASARQRRDITAQLVDAVTVSDSAVTLTVTLATL